MADLADVSNELEQCVLDLYKIGVAKFGDFILKSGIRSPFYFDLRLIISYPYILENVAKLMWNTVSEMKIETLCGVPYTALPIATVISIKNNIPMLIRRKEVKTYGTKQLIEGIYKEGQSCLIIEDVIVSGSSVYETVEILRKEKLFIEYVLVFLDREQGAQNNLLYEGIKVISVISITELLRILLKHQKIDEGTVKNCMNFLKSNNAVSIPSAVHSTSAHSEIRNLPITERSLHVTQPLVKKILDLIEIKKSNLCLAADVQTTSDLLNIADSVGPHICMLKTHIDILKDFSENTVTQLKELAIKHNFLLFEDRKFSDIGNTVKLQYSSGVYNIAEWADITSVHGISGPGVIKGLASALNSLNKGFVIVAEMSSEGNLVNPAYIKGCMKIAEENPECVVGFVAQSCITTDPNHILFTPGINLQSSGDSFGQKYVSVEEAVQQKGTDIIIVGRGITNDENPKHAALRYQERGFHALLKRAQK